MKQIATFAGGCFWCIDSAFSELKGVIKVTSGFTGGVEKKPSYELICTGKTNHREAVEIQFDPKEISYKELLTVFWKNIDPTDDGGQFADRGFQYTTAIYYHDKEQKKIAEESKKEQDESGKYDKSIATSIEAAKEFYSAEKYHQQYYKKCPIKYKMYRVGSGREAYIKEMEKKDNNQIKKVINKY